eukprot:jgi/Mesvir1/2186/Mv16691-RA.1
MSGKRVRVAINGFGRMGRLTFRIAYDDPLLDIVLINDRYVKDSAYLLKYDSVHGTWQGHDVKQVDDKTITVDGKKVAVSGYAEISKLPLKELAVDIVLECTGVFLTKEALQPYFDAGVKKVVVSAPVKSDALNIVYGCNEGEYDPSTHHIVTAASCTTNCLAPVVKVILENLGIRHGCITTAHNVTNTQPVVDAPMPGKKDDPRRARTAMLNLAPTSTGSATAISLIYPQLKGKLNGLAIRVPVHNASLTDCVFEVERPTTVEEVNALLKKASESAPLAGILGYEEQPLVSCDYINDPRSSIVDAPSTMVIDKTMVKIYAWYDNEWGYCCRMKDIACMVAKSL